MRTAKSEQRCYSFDVRELASKLHLEVKLDEWVVVEVDENTVDVMIRRFVEPIT